MNDSFTIPFIVISFVECQRCGKMPHPFIGLLFTGLVVRTVLAAIIVGAFVWLIFKLGKLADAYTEKLRTK